MQTNPRRTQQERSAHTRGKLIDATIDTLIERGLAKLTTTEVCKRAGTSQGALFKHFATKSALVSAAVAVLYDQLIDAYREAIQHIDPNTDLVDAAIDTLWQLFQTPRLLAVYELHIAARTDSELREVVAPMEQAHRAKIRELAGLIFPDAQQTPQFLPGIEVIINCVQGAAVGSMALREPAILAEMIAGLKTVARHFLETSPPAQIGNTFHAAAPQASHD